MRGDRSLTLVLRMLLWVLLLLILPRLGDILCGIHLGRFLPLSKSMYVRGEEGDFGRDGANFPYLKRYM